MAAPNAHRVFTSTINRKFSSIDSQHPFLRSMMAFHSFHAHDCVTVAQELPISHQSDTGFKPKILMSAGRVRCAEMIQPRCSAGHTKSLNGRQWKTIVCGDPFERVVMPYLSATPPQNLLEVAKKVG